MIKFEVTQEPVEDSLDVYPRVVFELPTDANLTSVIDAFENFLRAATYCFDGHLEIVEKENGQIDA